MSIQKKALANEPAQPIEYPSSDGKPMAETDIHRDLIAELIAQLETFFRNERDVYVSGNLLFYYVEGNPKKRFAPDVFVVRGVDKHKRRTYKLWEEGHAPEVVIEVFSRETWGEDLERKWSLFAQIGVKEYFLFDPEYDYLPNPLVGYRLIGNRYKHMKVKDDRLFSETLGLELVDIGQTLRLFNPKTGTFLPTREEERLALEKAEEARRQAEETLQLESDARQKAEAEIERLREKLEQLGIKP